MYFVTRSSFSSAYDLSESLCSMCLKVVVTCITTSWFIFSYGRLQLLIIIRPIDMFLKVPFSLRGRTKLKKFPVFGYRAPCYVYSLARQHLGDLLIRQRFLAVLLLDDLPNAIFHALGSYKITAAGGKSAVEEVLQFQQSLW